MRFMEYSLEELRKRHSVRDYVAERLPEDVMATLRAEVTMTNSQEAGLNFQLFFDDDDPFRGFSRNYGMIKNARNYLAAVIDPSFDNAEERAGYYGEQFVMKLVELGLGGCFISGTYSAAHVNARMEVYERLPYVMSFGIPTKRGAGAMATLMAKIVHAKKRSTRDMFAGSDEEYSQAIQLFPWLETALEGVLCAPSAANRQPVRIALTQREGIPCLEAFLQGGTPVELGIAKYNFQAPLSVEGFWEWGDHSIFNIFDE